VLQANVLVPLQLIDEQPESFVYWLDIFAEGIEQHIGDFRHGPGTVAMLPDAGTECIQLRVNVGLPAPGCEPLTKERALEAWDRNGNMPVGVDRKFGETLRDQFEEIQFRALT
jgi:hypothetical protein